MPFGSNNQKVISSFFSHIESFLCKFSWLFHINSYVFTCFLAYCVKRNALMSAYNISRRSYYFSGLFFYFLLQEILHILLSYEAYSNSSMLIPIWEVISSCNISYLLLCIISYGKDGM